MDFHKLAASTRKVKEAKQRTSSQEHRLTQQLGSTPMPAQTTDLSQTSPQP